MPRGDAFWRCRYGRPSTSWRIRARPLASSVDREVRLVDILDEYLPDDALVDGHEYGGRFPRVPPDQLGIEASEIRMRFVFFIVLKSRLGVWKRPLPCSRRQAGVRADMGRHGVSLRELPLRANVATGVPVCARPVLGDHPDPDREADDMPAYVVPARKPVMDVVHLACIMERPVSRCQVDRVNKN